MRRAGRQRITVKTAPKIEAIKPEVPSVVTLKIEQTPENILLAIEDELPKVEGQSIVKRLVAMEDKNGVPILSIRNRENIFQIIGMLQFMTIDALEAYFASRKFNEQAIWDAPIFNKERSKEYLDADIFLNRIRVKKGMIKCIRCPSEDVLYYELQTRGADEPPTIFFRCLQCNKSWSS